MDRIIVIGKNKDLPKNAFSRQLRICANCAGSGSDWGYATNNPSEPAHEIPCPCCKGQGATEK